MFWLGQRRFSNSSASRSTGKRPGLCTSHTASSFWGSRSNVGEDSSGCPASRSNPSRTDRIATPFPRRSRWIDLEGPDQGPDAEACASKHGWVDRKAINPVVRGWGKTTSAALMSGRSFTSWMVGLSDGSGPTTRSRWRNAGWKRYPTTRLRGEEFKLIGLVSLIPSLQAAHANP